MAAEAFRLAGAKVEDCRLSAHIRQRLVKCAAHRLDGTVFTGRVHAVREQDDVEILFRIDPERRPRETGVTDRA